MLTCRRHTLKSLYSSQQIKNKYSYLRLEKESAATKNLNTVKKQENRCA